MGEYEAGSFQTLQTSTKNVLVGDKNWQVGAVITLVFCFEYQSDLPTRYSMDKMISVPYQLLVICVIACAALANGIIIFKSNRYIVYMFLWKIVKCFIDTLLEWISPEITVKSLTSPSYPLNLPRHSLSTPRHPLMVTPECPDNSLTSPEVYPVYPDYPLRCPEKPMSALRTPWHPLMVIPDGPNYPLSFPEGHLRSLKTPWHPLLVWIGSEISFIKKNHKKMKLCL